MTTNKFQSECGMQYNDVAQRLKPGKATNGGNKNGAQASQSVVDILWELTESTPSGQYRLVYSGDRLAAQGEDPIPFEGVSRPFMVVNCVLDPGLPQCVGR